MLGWTDRHERFFLRQISRRVLLYSEMLAPEAIVLNERRMRYIEFDPQEHPVAFQLGGSQPALLAAAARKLEEMGYDEINFNVGCPAQGGHARAYGAHLMKTPDLVADCLKAMQDAVSIPVTIKTRIGIDHEDRYEPLAEFVEVVRRSGCRTFIVHARKAWLQGLSTRQNRLVPPLRYEYVYRLKREFPDLTVVINGQITEWDQVRQHLEHVDGVMIGRRAYKEPYWLATVDRDFFGHSEEVASPPEILRRCIPYVEKELARGTPLRDMVRHMVGLYRSAPAASAFRRFLSIECHDKRADLDTYLQAIRIADRTFQGSFRAS